MASFVYFQTLSMSFLTTTPDGEVWINPAQVARVERFGEKTRIMLSDGSTHTVPGTPEEAIRKLGGKSDA